MSEQPAPRFDEQNPPTHWHLLVELRVMQQNLLTVSKTIDSALQTHSALKEDVDALKIRVAQGVIIAVTVAMVFPIVINMMNPRIHFQSSPVVQPR